MRMEMETEDEAMERWRQRRHEQRTWRLCSVHSAATREQGARYVTRVKDFGAGGSGSRLRGWMVLE